MTCGVNFLFNKHVYLYLMCTHIVALVKTKIKKQKQNEKEKERRRKQTSHWMEFFFIYSISSSPLSLLCRYKAKSVKWNA